MIGRDTEWRQGDLLTLASAEALGLTDGGNACRVVVISHDCDLPNEGEEFVEVITGASVPSRDGMFAGARNPRRLHISFVGRDGADEELHVELRHANRRQVEKRGFAQIAVCEKRSCLPDDEKRALKQWLAARYGRPAFPNAFEAHLRKVYHKKTIEQRIAKILEPVSSQLVAVFFDLGEARATELAEGEPYFLSISLVYDATEGGKVAREAAEQASNEISTLFEQAFGPAATATEIALENCSAVADTFLTLADLRKVDQWRLEYISLREDPPGQFLPAGSLPP